MPAASTPHRVHTRNRAGKSIRKYFEPVLIRKKSASPLNRDPAYDVNALAIAAALRVYSDARDVAEILQRLAKHCYCFYIQGCDAAGWMTGHFGMRFQRKWLRRAAFTQPGNRPQTSDRILCNCTRDVDTHHPVSSPKTRLA